MTQSKEMTRIAAIGIALFLLAASPSFLASAQSTTTRTSLPSPLSNRQPLVGHSTVPKTPDSNKLCPTTVSCTYVADDIGGVQVFSGNKLIASVFVPLSQSDPYTCPIGALYLSSSTVWITDPCGNFFSGEIRIFDPSTNSFTSTVYTNAGFEPTFMALDSNGNVAITNFGAKTITVLTTSGASVTTVTTCDAYTEWVFLASNGDLLVSSAGFDTGIGCVDEISPSYSVVATAFASQSGGCNSYFEGVGEDKAGNVYVNCPYVTNSVGTLGLTDMTPLKGFGSSSSWTSVQPATGPLGDAYILWGMQSSFGKVYPIDVYQYNVSTGVFYTVGYTFSISKGIVGSAIRLGPAPDFSCFNSGTSKMAFPNIFGGTPNGPSILTQVSSSGGVKNTNYYGIVDGFGCTAGLG